MPAQRIAAFIRGEPGAGFDELALEAFRSQVERNAAFRALCEERGAGPDRVAGWRDVPAVPVAALDAVAPAGRQPHPELQRTVLDRSFPRAFLEGMGRPPVLSLIAAPEGPGPGWDALADHVLRGWAAADSGTAARGRGIEAAKARSFLAARQRDRRPTLILGTSATLHGLLEALERRGLRFRLPPGSGVVEAGGPGTGGPERLARLAASLDVPAERVLRVYGVSGVTSLFYAGVSRRGEPQPFRPPAWTRVRVLDPRTLTETPAGARGSISIFDLANLEAPQHVLTGDLAIAGGEAFEPLGGEPGAGARLPSS